MTIWGIPTIADRRRVEQALRHVLGDITIDWQRNSVPGLVSISYPVASRHDTIRTIMAFCGYPRCTVHGIVVLVK